LFDHIIARILVHVGECRRAAEILERSWSTAKETGVTFVGPFVLGLLAFASDEPGRRGEALHDGQTILDRGCVSHNYFWFYRYAMELRQAEGDWEGTDAYANALEAYYSPDPPPWVDFVVTRARALTQLARDGANEATLQAVRHVRDEAMRSGLHKERLSLEAALPNPLSNT
jgi:hypothetical protein